MPVKPSKLKKAPTPALSKDATTVFADKAGLEMSEFYRIMGRAICAAREAAGFTQADLASMIGHKRASVTHIEGGKQKPLPHILWLLVDILKVDLSALFPPTLAESRDLRATLDSLAPEVREKLERHLPVTKRPVR